MTSHFAPETKGTWVYSGKPSVSPHINYVVPLICKCGNTHKAFGATCLNFNDRHEAGNWIRPGNAMRIV